MAKKTKGSAIDGRTTRHAGYKTSLVIRKRIEEMSRIALNESNAQTLATLRDTLLPRLISVQLRLPEAEALLEAAEA